LARFGNAEAALEALPGITARAGRPPPEVPSVAALEGELARLDRLGGRVLLLGGVGYPPLLAMLEDAPPAISVLGDPALLSARAVALVGGRNATVNGRRIAASLAEGLAESGLAVVSGLARGVDAAAHAGAMRKGRTVAAIAGGLDRPYPPEHADLQRAIGEGGAVVAEQPLGTAPQARHFPRRNRIIAGLSLGVVVVEAAVRSGSLITARLAAEAGREVFAVPGSPLDPRCRGSNDLLRQGATLTETVGDVLEQIAAQRPITDGLQEPAVAWDAGLASDVDREMARSRLLDLLGPSPCLVDDLIRDCQLPTTGVLAALLDLELAGRLEMLPGNRVALLDELGQV
jgi:DNA processing protein